MNLNNLNELLYWSYANLAMAHSAVDQGAEKYSRINFIIRQRLFNGLMNDKMHIRTLFDDEKIKMINNDRCCYCGNVEKLTIDHLIPRFRGGEDTGDNLVYSCKSCNCSKGKKDLMEWMNLKDEFPTLMILRRYLKIIINYAISNSLMNLSISETKNKKLPFNIEFIPVDFPQPENLRLHF